MAEITSRYHREGEYSLIEIRLNTAQQLFNSFDPSPFHEKDLDNDAEEYIVGAVREMPPSEPVKLVFYLPTDALAKPDVATLAKSIHNYFDYRREAKARDLRFLLRDGRRALAIGLVFLSACLLVREILFSEGGPVPHVVGEGLIIAGWVAMWRPMEILLYDWWPLRRMRQIYTKLSVIPVEARPAASLGLSPAETGSPAG